MMAATLITQVHSFIGTAAERAALSTTGLPIGSNFYETDTNRKVVWDGSAWVGMLLPVNGESDTVSDAQTRPDNTTAYAALDVVGEDPADNISFVTKLTPGSDFAITSVSLMTSSNAVPAGMGNFRLHLYNAAPTAIADNTAYNLPSGDRTKYLGYITISTPVDLGDTCYGQAENINFQRKLAAGSSTLYGILQTVEAFTPTAQCVKTVTIGVVGL